MAKIIYEEIIYQSVVLDPTQVAMDIPHMCTWISQKLFKLKVSKAKGK